MMFRDKHLVIPLAGVLFLGLAASALAQSAVPSRGQNGAAASLKGENRGAVDTGKDAIARDRARRAAALANSSAAPVALALESGPAPDANPEPLTVVLIGGA